MMAGYDPVLRMHAIAPSYFASNVRRPHAEAHPGLKGTEDLSQSFEIGGHDQAEVYAGGRIQQAAGNRPSGGYPCRRTSFRVWYRPRRPPRPLSDPWMVATAQTFEQRRNVIVDRGPTQRHRRNQLTVRSLAGPSICSPTLPACASAWGPGSLCKSPG